MTTMVHIASHFHHRSTQRGSSWSELFRCPVCGHETRRIANMSKGKPAPECVKCKKASGVAQ